jgi:DNA polymerase
MGAQVTSRLRIDIETRSRVDLKKSNVYRYVECPDFQILMAAWSLDGSPTRVATSPRGIRGIPGLWDDSVTKVAHNAPFERVCFSRFLGMETGDYLPPEPWHDTAAVAREHGYPASLEAAAKWLGCTPKDSAGSRLIRLFCVPNRDGGFNDATTHPDEWLEFMAYCAQDVDTLAEVDEALGDFPTETERQVYFADQHINDHGFLIDAGMAQQAMQAAEANRLEQETRVRELTGLSNPGSQPQFLKWCKESISPRIPNIQKETVSRLLASDRLTDEQREVLELRQELALVASKKYASALATMCADYRLRGTLNFFGAHTARWSGRGTQVQNLPREAFVMEDPDTGKEVWDEHAEAAAILDLLMGSGATSLELKKLVRSLFTGPDGLTVVDYAAIEARVIAWWCGEEWALAAFRKGRDIYVETAERMGGLTRAQGKVAVLALGFAGGVGSLRAMGAEGTDQELQFLVDQWRRANPSIVRSWRLLGDAVADAQDGPVAVGQHVTVTRSGETMRIHLPSGRAITYHGVRWERYRVTDPKTGRPKAKEGWRYDNPKPSPPARIGTYGGRLAENVTQAIARDVMAAALVRLLRKGYQPVGHVHDEIIVEGTHPVDEISRIMCVPPKWAQGLPIDGEGFTTKRYRKG